MDLQPPSGIIAETATDLHNFLLVVITLISLFVLALLVYVCWRYKENSNKIPSKTSHNTIIEVLWTVIPVLILVVIAITTKISTGMTVHKTSMIVLCEVFDGILLEFSLYLQQT